MNKTFFFLIGKEKLTQALVYIFYIKIYNKLQLLRDFFLFIYLFIYFRNCKYIPKIKKKYAASQFQFCFTTAIQYLEILFNLKAN